MAKFLHFFLLTLFAYTLTSAQNSSTTDYAFTLTQSAERFYLEVNNDSKTLEVCGLEPGLMYDFHFNPFHSDGPTDMEITMDGEPRSTRFLVDADATCVVFQIRSSQAKVLDPNFDAILTVSQLNAPATIKSPPNDQRMPPITVNPNMSAQQLIQNVFIGSGCFDVTNVTVNGNANGYGAFQSGMTSIGFDQGFMMASGNVTNALGPNNSESTTTNFGSGGGDPDLAQLATSSVNDQLIIEFDFTPTVDTIEFRYVFASEEYCEFAPSTFNDVFGFFLSGPGINGPFSNNAENIALLPNGQFVAINTVNQATNSNFFVCNSPNAACLGLPVNAANDCEYDGWTRKLRAIAIVQPCQTYHIKLAICDVGDSSYDSAVFFRAGSFNAGGDADMNIDLPVSGATSMYEDCGDGYLTFFRADQTDIDSPLVLTYNIDPASTATPGVDYSANFNGTITIPPFQDSISIPISVFEDFLIEGQENILINLDNSCTCSSSQIEIIIEDKPPLEIALDTQQVCSASAVTLIPSIVGGGAGTLTFNWSTGATTPTITVNPNVNTEYYVTVTDECGQTDVDTGLVEILTPPTATLSGQGVLCNTSPQADLTVTFTGSPPWNLLYAIDGVTQPPITGITQNPYTLSISSPGTVTLLGVQSGPCPGTAMGSVDVTETIISLVPLTVEESCVGAANGIMTVTVIGATAPWSYNWSNMATGPINNNLFSGSYTVTVTDANGCTAEITDSVGLAPPMQANAVIVNQPGCPPNPGGALNVNVVNGTAPYFYLWSNGATVPNPGNLPAGTYVISVTDQFNCAALDTVELIAPDTLDLIGFNISGTDCLNPSNGGVNIAITGGTQPINYQWSNGSTNMNLSNVMEGTYTVNVTDVNGCTFDTTFVVPGDFDLPIVEAGNPILMTCIDSTGVLDGTGTDTGQEFNYTWTSAGGSIISGGNTLMPTVSGAGTYTLTVSNVLNGCTSSDVVIVTEDVTEPTNIIAPPNALTCSITSINLDASGSSQGPDFSYQWTTSNGNITGGNTSLNPSVDQGGTYTLVITDASNGCTSSNDITVNYDTLSPTINFNGPFTLDCINSVITVDANGSSSGPNFIPTWTTSNGNIVSGGNTLNPSVDQPGTYTLQIEDTANGCLADAPITVGIDTLSPVSNAGPGPEIDCANPTVQLNGNGSSAGPDINYNWTTNGGGTIQNPNSTNPTVNAPGTYTLTVTNTTNGCTSQDMTDVSINVTPPTAQAGNLLTLTCSDSTGFLDGTGSNFGTGYTVQWSGGVILNGGNTLNPEVAAPGTYTILVTDTTNGCTSNDNVTVVGDFNPPIASAGPQQLLNCIITQTFLDGSGSSQGPDFNYQWTTNNGVIVSGGTTPTPEIGATGTYTLIVTDATNGCTATSSVMVAADTASPTAAYAPPPQITCTDTFIQLNANGSSSGPFFTVNWTTPNGNIVGGENTPTPVVDQVGQYVLEVTNTLNGCTDTAVVTVTQDDDTPVANAGPPTTLTCDVLNAMLDGSASSSGPNYSYLWTTTNGGVILNPNNPIASVNAPGLYTIQVEDLTNGCVQSSSVIIDIDTLSPVADAGLLSLITCTNSVISLDGSSSNNGPGYSILWSTPDGNIVSGGNTVNPIVDMPGTYIIQVTDDLTGCSSTDAVPVVPDTVSPVADAGLPDFLTCSITSLLLNGSGSSQGLNYSYAWSTANGNIVADPNTLSPTIDQTGTYTLVVTNTNNGCTQDAQVQITIDTVAPSVNIAPADLITCVDTTVFLNGTGSSSGNNFSYTWTTANGVIINGQNTLTPLVGSIGAYTLTVTNALNGCVASNSVLVTQDDDTPVANAGPTSTITCNLVNATLDGSGSSTGPNYSYLWTSSSGGVILNPTNLMASVNAPGLYTLEVEDLTNGCVQSSSVIIDIDTLSPTADAGAMSIFNCVDTILVLDGSGSTIGPGYSIQWSTTDGNITNGGNTVNPIVNMPGTYIVQITNDQTGCDATDAVSVVPDTVSPLADAGTPDLLTCSTTSLLLDGSNSSQGPSYTYTWTTSDGNIILDPNTTNPTIDQTGTYTLLVTNTTNGCTDEAQVQITIDTAAPAVNIAPADLITCVDTTISLDGTGSSAGGNFTYNWTTNNGLILTGQNTTTPLVGDVGFYTLAVTNTQNGCVTLDSVQVTQDANTPVADPGPDGTLTCDVASLILDGSNSSQGGLFSYTWTTTDGGVILNPSSDSPTISSPGTYNLVVENVNNGCTDEASVVIDIDTLAPQVEAGPNGLLDCFNPQINLTGSTATMGNLTIIWNTTNGAIMADGNTLNPLVNGAGNYTLTIENDDNGCIASDVVAVSIDTIAPIADAGPSESLTCVENEVNLDGSNSSSGPNISYTWDTNTGNIISGQNSTSPLIDGVGDYGLLVTNTTNGCTDSASVQVTLDVIIPQVVVASAGTISCVVDSALLDGTGSDLGPDFSYEWVTPDGSIIGINTALQAYAGQAGTYFLVVTNEINGCQDSLSTQVPDNFAVPNANAGITAELNCTVTEIILDGTNSSVGPGFDAYWITSDGNFISGDQTLNPTVNETGTYTIVVTDLSSGCTSSADVLITQDASLPVADAGPFGTLTCTDNTYQVDGNASSFGADVIFSWSTTNGNIVSGGNTLSPLVDLPGSYVLTLLDTSNNCEVTSTVQVDIDTVSPGISFVNPDILNCLDLTVPVEANITNATSSQLTWSTSNGSIQGPNNTAVITVNSPGDYILDVLNSDNGCTSQSQITVTQDTVAPVADAGAVQTLNCFQPALNVGGAGTSSGPQYLYTWTLPNGTQWIDTTATIAIDQQGTYNLLVTNTINNCVDQDQVQISDDFVAPSMAFNNPAELNCQVLQSDVEVIPGAGTNFIFAWTDENNVNLGNSALISVNLPGTYYATVTNTDNGCLSVDSTVVSQDILAPAAEAGLADTLDCTTTSITLDGQGSSTGGLYTYTWTSAPGNILNGGNTLNPLIDAAGTYILEVTNTQNFCVSTDVVTISLDDDAPVAIINPAPPLTCVVTDLTLDATGSSTGSTIFYEWTTTGGNIVNGANTLNPLIDQDGQYVLTVIDSSNFCVTTANTQIDIDTVSPSAQTDLPGALQLDCDNNTLVVDGSGSAPAGSIDFQWSTQNGSIISGTTNSTITINEPGTYNLLITNTSNGCTSQTDQLVNQDITPPTISILPAGILTCIVEELTINASASSTGTDFQYQWTGGNIISGGNTLTPLVDQPGTYILTITNSSNGCTSTDNLQVEQDIATPTVVVSSEGALNCISESLNILGVGSSTGSQYQYAWTTTDGTILSGQNELNATASSSGTYVLVITNILNGCQNEDFVVIDENDAVPSAISLEVIPPACKGQVGSILVNGATGGNPPYLYALNDDGFYPPSVFSNLAPGEYVVTVQDVIGCEFEQTISIPDGEEIIITLDPEINLILGSSTQLQAVVNIPEDQISSILWTPDNYLSCTDCLDPYVDLPLQTILYRLFVESEKGCHGEAEILVHVEKPRDVFIPNVFSPLDQDGVNDIIYISANTVQVSGVKSFLIFDRWGEKIYERYNFQPNDPEMGWNGTLKGQFLNPGVFVYYAEIEFIDGETILYKGDITIPD